MRGPYGFSNLEIHRAYTVQNPTQRNYTDSNRFTVLSGQAFFDDTGLHFPHRELLDREYVTVFGPCFVHSGRRFKLDDVGLRGAVTRLTCAREVDRPYFHDVLRDNQFLNYGDGPLFRSFEEHITLLLRRFFIEEDNVESRVRWVDAIHPKRRLRQQTHHALWHGGRVTHPTWMGDVKYVCKPGEILPPGKFLRAIGDLGPAATARAGHLMEHVKNAFAVEYRFGDSSYQFVKSPSTDLLSQAFCDVLYTNDMSFRCFSDDSIVGVATPEGRFYANADISACDGSNFDPVFNFLRRIMINSGANVQDVNGVFDQCRAICRIYPIKDKHNPAPKGWKIKLRPRYATLYSGSVLTTSINNCANFGIYSAFAEMLPPYPERTFENVSACLVEAAFRMGFVLRADRCACPEKLQFLKSSPALVDGHIHVFLNVGVMFRSFGTFHGDLPGTGPIQDRARTYNSDVVRAFVHAGDHAITTAFRTHIIDAKHKTKDRYYNDATRLRIEGVSKYIPLSALAARYDVSISEIEQLADAVQSSTVGTLFSSRALQVIDRKSVV